MTETTTPRSAPVATFGIVSAEVRSARRRAPEGGTLYLRAAAEWRGPGTFDIDGVSVQVVPCTSLLGILDAVTTKAADFLVVLSPFERRDLGDSLLAHAIRHDIVSVNRWDLVRHAFGAKQLDPRLTAPENAWLSEALLESQPPGGWPKIRGALLDLDTAVGEIAAARLGLGGPPDAASLLAWSRDIAAVSRFTTLDDREQHGIADWLARSVGPVADVLFRLVRAGHATDAVAAGLITRLLRKQDRRQAVIAARVRAERMFGGTLPGETALDAFAEASESLLLRWIDGDETHARSVLQRAHDLLEELQAGDLAADSRVLEAGFLLRLKSLVKAVEAAGPDPLRSDVAAVDEKLAELIDHQLHESRPETQAAIMAARLVRWLAGDPAPSGSLREQVDRHVRDGAWVDRAVISIRYGAHDGYDGLLAAVRARRDDLDRVFAERLAAWSGVSGQAQELVLVENLLAAVARPVAELAAPLIVIVDGMTAAIAGEITDEITRGTGDRWTEIGRHAEGREGALATVPSITTYSRTSLLSGELARGQQAEETRGFRGFWGTRSTALFHKADVRDGVSAEIKAAIADRNTIVGVVLNAVDDSLDKGRADGGADWHADGIAGFVDVLAAAWQAGRPVIIVSDHGHVLDRGDATITTRAEAARYRTGKQEAGEVAVSGPRVLTPEGTVVVPWKERIRYSARKEGYHGGVSLAEMVVPIVVLVPSEKLVPDGWETYRPAVHEPVWWNRLSADQQGADRTEVRAPAKPAKPVHRRLEDALFDVETESPSTAEGIGGRVVESKLFGAQSESVRTPVAVDQVAALIDALAQAGGKLPLAVAAQRAGQLPARMHGYVSTVAKLLNVDGYQVLGVTDGGRTVALDLPLLREQFLGGG